MRWFPFLPPDIRAAGFQGGANQAAILADDPGADSALDVKSGETVSLEAWIKVDEAAPEGVVLLGKGVARGAGRSLNYGLGVRFQNTMLWPSFVFTPAGTTGTAPLVRWETTTGFPVDSDWHHVVATFTFGQPESLRFHLDGASQQGRWTDESEPYAAEAPAVNDLPLRIAETAKGAAFRGAITEVQVYRRALSTGEIRSNLITPLPIVAAYALPQDCVRVELREGAPFSHGWIFDTTTSRIIETYDESALGFYRLPQRYVESGVRGEWPNPLLLRAAARITLPAGRHRFLLRALGAARLLMDNRVVAEIDYRQFDQSGNAPVEFTPEPPTLDTRPLAPACRELLVEVDVSAGEHVVIFETRLGGRSTKRGGALRRELGETLVAVQLAGEREYTLVGPRERVPLTNAGWVAFVQEREKAYDRLDAGRRAALHDADREYWQKRHAEARDFIAMLPPLAVPAADQTLSEANLVDRFVNASIARVRTATSAAGNRTVRFHRDVLPILEKNCFSCHGAKAKGDLRLDRRQAAFAGGGSGAAGIVPGKPHESEILRRILSDDPEEIMPTKGDPLTPAQAETIKTWIHEGAAWPDETPADPEVTPLADDLEFIRRIHLDVVGQTPPAVDVEAFLSDRRVDKRARWIDRLLADPRWADHWVSYWQDLLAENPTLANLTLNVTGPFRWWIYESFLDNRPMDVFATELIGMHGSYAEGGPAGFALAAENDAPMAEKAAIVSAAFLGVQMKCARCHDAPFNAVTQKDLFSLAAMLNQAPLSVPSTSSVPSNILAKPNSLIKVTLAPGSAVAPEWSLASILPPEKSAVPPAGRPITTRDTLAAAVASPRNLRFAEVIVNRLWARYFGRGLVTPLDDWENANRSHPELLEYLARELMTHDFDLKHVARLLLNSHAYQRTAFTHDDSNRLFSAPPRRQMTAEQLVDSLPAAFGVQIDTEPLNLDLHNTREFTLNQNLDRPAAGIRPRRAWQFAPPPLDRDRPSLMLPRVQAVVDVLTAFGWRGSRFDPVSARETPMNPLQPAALANGTFALWLVRLTDESVMTKLALSAESPDDLVRSVFLRVLNRPPRDNELSVFSALLAPGFESRSRSPGPPNSATAERRHVLSWTNHLSQEGNELRLDDLKRTRLGPPPTARLDPDWRQRCEDMLWALLNSPETISIP